MAQSSFNWEFEIPTWERIYGLLLDLASKVRRNGFKPDVIVGVARGGWPPARVMSDLLENPEVASVKADFYSGVAENKGQPVITQSVSLSVKGKKILIVDDVADTGKSLALVKEHLKERGASEVKAATIYYKPWSEFTPDYFERKTSHWIVFPWERKETVRRILEKCRKDGVSSEKAMEILARCGFGRRLVKRFIAEIAEGQS